MHASTIHALFHFDGEYKSKIDFGKLTQSEVELILMEVLLLDEVSMLDDPCFAGICDVMSIIDHSRRPAAREADCFGQKHLIMFGDFKQEIKLYWNAFCSQPNISHVSWASNKNHAVVPRARCMKVRTTR